MDGADQWAFTGCLRDNLLFDGQCSFCGAADLRITFEVVDGDGGAKCHVCDHCMCHGEVCVEHEGHKLEGTACRDVLDMFAVRHALQSCREILRQLLARTDDPAMREAAAYFQRNVQLSPAHAATVLLQLSKQRTVADPRIFDVRIRSIAHRLEFGQLSTSDKLLVWPLLSPTVQNRLISMDLAPDEYLAGKQMQRGRQHEPRGAPKLAWQ